MTNGPGIDRIPAERTSARELQELDSDSMREITGGRGDRTAEHVSGKISECPSDIQFKIQLATSDLQ